MPPTSYIEELWVGIRADMSGLQRGLTGAKASTKTFVGQLGAMTSQLRSVGKTTTIVSAIILGLGALVTAVFAKFEQSMANTQSVLGATQQEFEILSDYAREMGKTTVFTASQAADAMYYLASAGYDTQQVMGALQGTLQLAAATQYDLAETTRIVVSTLNQFSLGAEKASDVANVFAAIISATQATMDRLGDSLKFVGPIAAGMNIPLEQTVAALGALYNAGLQASQAGTSLRQGLLNLQAPTQKMQKAIKSLGLTYDDVNPQTHDLVEIIRTLESVSAGATEQGDEMAAIFGKRAVTAFQVLVRMGATALENLQEKITGTTKASSMAETQINTLKGSFKLLMSALQEAAIQIGEILAPAIRGIADIMRDAVQIFNELPSILKTIMVTVPMVAAAFGLLVGPIMLLLSMIPKMVAGLGALNVLMHGALGIVGAVALAIAALTGLIGFLISAERRHRESTNKNLKLIDETIGKRIDEVKETKALISEYQNLSSKAKLSNDEQERMNTVIDELNSKYPDLNLETENYANNLGKVETASKDAADELLRLMKIKKTLEKIKVTIEIIDFKKEIREAKEDLRDIGTSLDDWTGAGYFTFDKSGLLGSLDLLNELSSEIGKIGSKTGSWTVQLISVERAISKIALEEKGISRITSDLEVFSEAWSKNETEILDIKKQAEEAGRNLTGSEIKRTENLKETAGVYREFITMYSNVLKKSGVLTESEVKLQEALHKRKVLLEEIETVPSADPPDPPKPSVVKTEEEIELEKQKQELIFQLHKQTLESQLAETKTHRTKSLSDAIKFIEQEAQYKTFILNKEKESAVEKAKEVGLSVSEVEKSFISKSVELERQKQEKIAEVKKEYSDKDDQKEANRLEWEASQNEGALEIYKSFLQKELEAFDEYSDEYMEILKKITAIEENEYRKRMKVAQEWANSVSWMATRVGYAYGKQIAGNMTGAWKESLKAVIDMIAGYYINILKLGMAADFAMGNYAAAAYKAAQTAVITGIKEYAKANIDSAQIGADVKRSGIVNVHSGEQIVPAHVVRKSKEEYQKTSEYTNNINNNQSFSEALQSMEMPPINIYYPMVDDDGFWESVFEEHIKPAWDKNKKRFEQ